MASVVKRVNGTREVQLTVDGQRKTVSFGKVTAKQARSMHLNLANNAPYFQDSTPLSVHFSRVMGRLDRLV